MRPLLPLVIFLVLSGNLHAQQLAREIFSESELARQNALVLGSPRSKFYTAGILKREVQLNEGEGQLALPSSGVAVSIKGMTNINLSRLLKSDEDRAWKEFVSGSIGDDQVLISFSPQITDQHFLDEAFSDGRPNLRISHPIANKVKRKTRTELEAFDLIASINRDDVIQSRWPESSELFGLLYTFIFNLILNGENLYRVDNGVMIVFIGIQDTGDQLSGMAQVFDKVSGRRVGSLLLTYKAMQKPSVDKILGLIGRIHSLPQKQEEKGGEKGVGSLQLMTPDPFSLSGRRTSMAPTRPTKPNRRPLPPTSPGRD